MRELLLNEKTAYEERKAVLRGDAEGGVICTI
jgi:hypothetical protein